MTQPDTNIVDLSLFKTENDLIELVKRGHLKRLGKDKYALTAKGKAYVESQFLGNDPEKIKRSMRAKSFKEFADICFGDKS